ncbi:hypothetical protein MVEN_00090700 [Mycena venus]|uniref:Uncharacterized protein n=1 Tax=Mycena venus TaxID=2733690 RepID=A0A8H6ZAT4_9AGAR|nr:hypothetical protein MVEN_00090700 [Mycena venus]
MGTKGDGRKNGPITPHPKQKTDFVVNISDASDAGSEEETRVQGAVKASPRNVASREQTGTKMQAAQSALNLQAAKMPKSDKEGVLSQHTDCVVDMNSDSESNKIPQQPPMSARPLTSHFLFCIPTLFQQQLQHPNPPHVGLITCFVAVV